MQNITYIGRDDKGASISKKLFDVLDDKDVWEKDGLTIIGLKGVKKLAASEGIVEKKITTDIVPTGDNKQQHGINIWVGYKGDIDPDNWVRGSGEASMLNTGKIVVDKKTNTRRYEEYACVDSQYRYAMADKRAYCRAILKFVQIFNAYASVESSSFAPNAIKGYDY